MNACREAIRLFLHNIFEAQTELGSIRRVAAGKADWSSGVVMTRIFPGYRTSPKWING